MLFNSTTLIVFIDDLVLIDNQFNEDLIYHPIWRESKLVAYVNENAPVLSWLKGSNSQEFTGKEFISLPKTIENLNDQLVLKVDKEDSFKIEQTTGYIWTLQEFNYEQIKEMNVSISACIRSTNTCFR